MTHRAGGLAATSRLLARRPCFSPSASVGTWRARSCLYSGSSRVLLPRPRAEVPQDPRLVVSPADGKVVAGHARARGRPAGPGLAPDLDLPLDLRRPHQPRAHRGHDRARRLPQGRVPARLRPQGLAAQRAEQRSWSRTAAAAWSFKQIAGLIARRIVFRKRVATTWRAGERVGLIKFGSRVDVFVPAGSRSRVKVGDRVAGGTSVLARASLTVGAATQAARTSARGFAAGRRHPAQPLHHRATSSSASGPSSRRSDGQYAEAAPLIFWAIVLDMLDGRIARLTGTTSEFGGELDSLADVDLVRRGARPPGLLAGASTTRAARGLAGRVPVRGLRRAAPGALQRAEARRRRPLLRGPAHPGRGRPGGGPGALRRPRPCAAAARWPLALVPSSCSRS